MKFVSVDPRNVKKNYPSVCTRTPMAGLISDIGSIILDGVWSLFFKMYVHTWCIFIVVLCQCP